MRRKKTNENVGYAEHRSITIQIGGDLDILKGERDELDDNTKNAHRWYEKKDIWWQMIQLLPSSYNQTRNVMTNYEVLANIYKSRKDHKLDEWRNFCKWIEELPYSELITGKTEEN